jgi:hypothetical protein
MFILQSKFFVYAEQNKERSKRQRMDMTTLLLGLIGLTVVLLVFGTLGYWFHLRLLRLEQRLCDCNSPAAAVEELVECGVEEPILEDEEDDDRLSVPESELIHQDIEVPESNELDFEEADDVQGHSGDEQVVEQEEHSDESEEQPDESEEQSDEQENSMTNESVPAETPDYESMTIPVLRDLCTSRGIAWTRKDRKGDLITHLQSSDARE